MPPLCRTERAALAELLGQLGPDAPTLAGDWTTRDLAAHLVVRERRLDATPGVAVPWLAWRTNAVQRAAARRPYDELVADVRNGPPPWSPFAVPAVDKLFNTTEFFVHHEDVRRAQPGGKPRVLPDKVQDSLWRAVQGRARLAFRSVDCGVVLTRPGGDSCVAKRGDPAAVLTGEPQELLLYVFGRKQHSRVQLSGPREARRCLDDTTLDV